MATSKELGEALGRDCKNRSKVLSSLFHDCERRLGPQLAIFLGAGASRLLGCWGWDELAAKLLDLCLKSGCLSPAEYDVVQSKGYASEKMISVCFNLLGKENGFWDTIKQALGGK